VDDVSCVGRRRDDDRAPVQLPCRGDRPPRRIVRRPMTPTHRGPRHAPAERFRRVPNDDTESRSFASPDAPLTACRSQLWGRANSSASVSARQRRLRADTGEPSRS
jgi:hypothetical protein